MTDLDRRWKWQKRAFIWVWSWIGGWRQANRVRLADLLSRFMRPIFRQRWRIAGRNIDLCFPQKSIQERQLLRRRSFREATRGLVETSLIWFGTDRDLLDRSRLRGLERIKEELGKGRGVLLLAPHFSSMELCGKIVGLSIPCVVVYRTLKQPWLDQIVNQARSPYVVDRLTKTDLRRAVRYLREGEVVWYSPDLYPGPRSSIAAPLFGHRVPTTTAVQRIARATGCAVISVHVVRSQDGQSYVCHFGPALEHFPSDDAEADALRVNQELEQLILRCPEQYLWTHRRFKTMTSHKSDPYN